MRLFFPFVLFVFVGLTTQAGVSLPIDQVQVFSNGAEIIRNGNARLSGGVDTIVVEGVSPFVNQNTIQGKIEGARILDVWFNVNYSKSPENSPALQKVKLDIKQVEVDILNVKDQLTYLEFEYDLIHTNKQIRGNNTLDIDDIKDFVFYYKSKLPSLIKEITNNKQQLKKFEEVLRKLKQQERELQNQPVQQTGEIFFVVQSSNKSATIEVKYHVSRCGWSPLYNLRADKLNEPIQFEYNAMVYQNTGVNWEQCNLIIATGNPVLNGNKPELYPWRLREVTPVLRGFYDSDLEQESDNFAGSKKLREVSAGALYDSAIKSNQKPIQQKQLTFSSFIIPAKFSLNSGAKNKRVNILEKSLPATFNYYAVPKLNNGVFLVANITEWEKLPLIPGKSQIYFDGTFVGKSYINPATMEDTLTLSLGQDKSILVERKKQEDQCINGSNMLGAYKKRAYSFQIKNNRDKAIQIKVMDQVPISGDNKIKVNYDLGTGWVIKEETGILEWNLEVPANEKASNIVKYEVKHPKRMKIALE